MFGQVWVHTTACDLLLKQIVYAKYGSLLHIYYTSVPGPMNAVVNVLRG